MISIFYIDAHDHPQPAPVAYARALHEPWSRIFHHLTCGPDASILVRIRERCVRMAAARDRGRVGALLQLSSSNDWSLRALARLRNEGILILGSGGVTHNQDVFRRGFFSGADVATPEPFSRAFDSWVSSIVTSEQGDSRARALAKFEEHRFARVAHPTVEHFMPVLVLAGAAGADRGQKIYEGFQHSLATSAFQFG